MGGFAIQGVRRISGDDARSTLEYIKKFLDSSGIKISMLMGSAWNRKDGLSGDLDLGVHASTQAEFTGLMHSKIGHVTNGRAMPGISVYSFGFPINGSAANGTVQVDLMPVYYPEWSKFVYAPVTGSMKSAHRNWLLWSLAKSRGVKFDLNRGAVGNNGHTADPDTFLCWLGLDRSDIVNYETLSLVVPQPVIMEAMSKLKAVR